MKDVLWNKKKRIEISDRNLFLLSFFSVIYFESVNLNIYI